MPPLARSALAWLVAVTLASPALAQDLAEREAALARDATHALLGFARTAELARFGTQARDAYLLIVEHYDYGHRRARRALGFTQRGGIWHPPTGDAIPAWIDAAEPEQRQAVMREREKIAAELAKRHHELGFAAVEAGDEERAGEHLRLAVTFDPEDRAAHEALGHEEFNGFLGDDAQIAFLRRLERIRTFAEECAARDHDVTPLGDDVLPAELFNVGRPMTGARSRHFEIWTRSEQAHTEELARWAERALEFLEFLLAEDPVFGGEPTRQCARSLWLGIVRGDEERDRFLRANPHVLPHGMTADDVRRFSAYRFQLEHRFADVAWHEAEHDLDFVVAHVTQRCFAGLESGNAGLGQGLVHAATWFLVGTTNMYYRELPKTDLGGPQPPAPDPETWLARLRRQIAAGADWPLEEVPRERSDQMRSDVRMKSWWFVVWLVAREPQRWARLTRAFPADVVPLPEECARIIAEQLGRSATAVEAEWRTWASGTSAIARASGHGVER